MNKILVLIFSSIIVPVLVFAQAAKAIQLPAPQTKGGKPLMETLSLRHTAREFSPKALVPQVLSDLLWAANGINRPASNGHTAPTAMNLQEIDIYVALADGLYLYDAKANALTPVVAGDIREATGKQPFVKDAPVNLIFVADTAKMTRLNGADVDFYAATDTGFISQNVYLFCASQGLNTVVRGWLDKPALAKAMKLNDKQKIILAQTVGYPAK